MFSKSLNFFAICDLAFAILQLLPELPINKKTKPRRIAA